MTDLNIVLNAGSMLHAGEPASTGNQLACCDVSCPNASHTELSYSPTLICDNNEERNRNRKKGGGGVMCINK